MAERIDLPTMDLSGSTQTQLNQIYRYLYRTAQVLNVNLNQIGNGALTDDESALMNQLTAAVNSESKDDNPYQYTYNYAEAETLKSLIIKTAQFVKNEVDNYRLILFGEESAEGQYGNWKRKKGLRVDVTPDGVKQTYSYAEIVKGLKTFEVNAKNYIKTGYLRTENSIPIYGVAIGRDVVTFSEDGTETYNDGNKVAELTADALSFYQSGKMVAKYAADALNFYQNNSLVAKFTGSDVTFYASGAKVAELTSSALKFLQGGNVVAQFTGNALGFYQSGALLAQFASDGMNFYQNSSLVAKYTASKISFYAGGSEVFYIQSGKVYSSVDLELGSAKNVTIGNWKFNTNGMTFYSGSTPLLQLGRWDDKVNGVKAGLFVSEENGYPQVRLYQDSTYWTGQYVMQKVDSGGIRFIPTSDGLMTLGASGNKWNAVYADWFYGTVINSSSRDIKHDIHDMPDPGETIDQLRPVTFVYDDDQDERKHNGLIYEETENVIPEMCTGDEANKGLMYTELIPILLKEIQNLRQRVSELERS